MVSHSHLSAGNSESSQSRDLFAEFGVSNPNSPSLSSPLVLCCDDMVESDAVPQAISVSSNASTSLDLALEVNAGPALGSEAQEIFKSAQYFSRKDREDALHERKKNSQLMEFISAHGFAANYVNAFLSDGTLANPTNALKVFDECPLEVGGPSKVQSFPASTSFLGGKLTPVSCVGEVPQPERVFQSPAGALGIGAVDVRRLSNPDPNSYSKSCSIPPHEEVADPRQHSGPTKS